MALVQDAATLEVLERTFERKRANFLADYELRDSPSLIWQMGPESKCSVDLSNADVAQTIREGSATSVSDGWWHGFGGRQHPALVFDGLASHRKDHLTGYVTELHSDGHFLAGIWTFPEHADRAPGVASFYAAAFADALDVGVTVLRKAGVEGALLATCTMSGADRLPLINQRGVLAGPSTRSVLRWPIHTVGTTSKEAVQRDMASQFMRIYGKKWNPD